MCNERIKIKRDGLPNGTDEGEAMPKSLMATVTSPLPDTATGIVAKTEHGTLNWYAVYTRVHHERKAANRLTRQGIQTYVPVQTVTRQWSDRLKKMEVVVIPTLFFVRIPKDKQLQVLRDPSVSRFLTAPGERTPAIIPTHQLKRFRFLIENANSPIDFEPGKLVAGDQVRVIRGSLKGLEGTFIKQQEHCKLYIRLNLLGNVGVVIPASVVEVI